MPDPIPTPRTDALEALCDSLAMGAAYVRTLSFARELERELAAKDAHIAKLKEALEELTGASEAMAHLSSGSREEEGRLARAEKAARAALAYDPELGF